MKNWRFERILTSSDVNKCNSITHAISKLEGISVNDVKGKCRKKEYVIPRQIAIHMARSKTNMSLVNIGEFFGGRDHATVIHSINKINDEINMYEEDSKRYKRMESYVDLWLKVASL